MFYPEYLDLKYKIRNPFSNPFQLLFKIRRRNLSHYLVQENLTLHDTSIHTSPVITKQTSGLCKNNMTEEASNT